MPHDVGGPADDPFYRPNWYRFQDVSMWKDLGPKFVLQVWRDALAAGADAGDALIRDAFPTVERVLGRLAASDRDGDGLPEHDGVPDQTYDTWPMRGPSAYGGSLWLAATRAAEAMARRLGDSRGGGSLGRLVRARPRSRSTSACGVATTTPTTTAAARAPTASWPTSWQVSGTPTRPVWAICCRPTIGSMRSCAPSTPATSVASAGAGWAQ